MSTPPTRRRTATLGVLLAVFTLLGTTTQPLNAGQPADPKVERADQAPPPGASYQVALRSRTFTPEPGLQLDAIRGRRGAGAGAADGDVHFLLQLVRIPTVGERASFANHGVTVLSFLSGTTYVASAPLGVLDDLATLEGIRAALPLEATDKLEPVLARGEVPAYARRGTDKGLFDIQFHADVDLDSGLDVIRGAGGRGVGRLESINALTALLDVDAVPLLAARDEVAFVGASRPPLGPEVSESRAIAGATPLAAAPYNLDGTGVTAMVFDTGRVDETHPDLAAAVVQRDDSAVTEHATHVTGILAGRGVNSPGGSNYAGYAPGAKIRSFGLDPTGPQTMFTDGGQLEDNARLAMIGGGMDLINMSLGANVYQNPTTMNCSMLGDYSQSAAVIDSIVKGSLNVPMMFVKSAGNEQNAPPGETGVCGDYGTISPPGSAKNSIGVGSFTTGRYAVSSFSSFGPTDDGRVKPDVVAPGCHDDSVRPMVGIVSTAPGGAYVALCGTSQAAPAVSGIAALMVQQWKADHPGEVLSNATVKALLVHTAIAPGASAAPTYQQGYGLVNAKAAVDAIKDRSEARIKNEEIDNAVTHTYRFYSDGTAKPKVTLAWDDPAAALNAQRTLVNDLDVRLIAPGETARQAPWTLDPLSPAAPATRVNNNRDNVEVAQGAVARQGEWTVRVTGTRVAAGPQKFTLVTPPAYSLSTTEATVQEGNAGSTEATFAVTLSEPRDVAVSFNMATEAATATSSEDFTPTSGTLTIPAGERTVTFSVPVAGDLVEEPTETFLIRLTNPVNASLENSFTHGYILDDDQPRDYDVMAATGVDSVPTSAGVESPLTLLGNAPSINDKGSVAFTGTFSGTTTDGLLKGTGPHAFTHLTYGFTSTSRKWGAAAQINDHEIIVSRDRISGSPPPNRIRVWDGTQAQGCAIAGTPCWSVVASGGNASPGKSGPDFDSVDAFPSISNAVTTIGPTFARGPAWSGGSQDLLPTSALDFRNGVAFKAQRGGFGLVATPQRQVAGSPPNPFNQTTESSFSRPMIAENGETVFRRGLPTWSARNRTLIGDVTLPTSFSSNGFRYEAVSLCIHDGGAHCGAATDQQATSSSEPVWPTGEGATVTDNGVTWKNAGAYSRVDGVSFAEELSIVVMEPDQSLVDPSVWHRTSAVTVIAGKDNGFTRVGRAPGISDDGQIVTFYGELSAAKATEYATTPGPGIFASVRIADGTRLIERIAGVAGNGFLDPGETFVDLNANKRFDAGSGEVDKGTFASFDGDSRVMSNATQKTLRSTGIAYLAFDAAGAKGLYVTRLQFVPREGGGAFDSDDPGKLEVKGTRTVVKEGDQIAGLPGRVGKPAGAGAPSPIGIYDPINDRQEGDVAFWVETVEDKPDGTKVNRQAIIRSLAPKTPVLFIPGIAGSELYDRAGTVPDAPMGEKIWLDPQYGYDDYLRTRLSLRPEHTALRDIYAPDILRYVQAGGFNLPTRAGKVYGPFTEALAAGGYTEYRVPFDRPEYRTATGCDLTQKPNRPDLFVFPYDWRLDNGVNAQKVAQFMGCIQLLYPGSEVNILTHSMGGLLGRRYLIDNPENPVHAMITVAGPWLGAPKLPYVLESGDFAAPVATGPGVAYAAQSLTAAHQLSPSRGYFDLGGRPIGDKGKDEDGNGVGTELYSFDQFKQFENQRYAFSTPGDTADNFHSYAQGTNAQDDWRLDSTGIIYHHLYAVQEEASTVGQMLFKQTLACRLGINDEQTCARDFSLEINRVMGDGTVPEISASRRASSGDLNAPDATLHPFVGPADSDSDDFDHNKMLHNVEIQKKVLELLNFESPRTQTSSGQAVGGADPTEPADPTGGAFREVDLYHIAGLRLADDLGNSTDDLPGFPGFPGTVPGATTFVLSPDSRNVVVDDAGTYVATFQTTGTPLTVALTTSDGLTTSEVVSWRDLDLPAGRTVRLTLRADGTSELTWDDDGDAGTAEVALPATSTASGAAAADDAGPDITHSERAVGRLVEVTLAATDPAGVAGLRYSTDGTIYRSYTAPFTVDPETVSLVTAYADDSVGNRSAITEVPIAVLNQPPVASALGATTAEDSAGAAITLAATDPDGDPITYTVTRPPASGTLTGSGAQLTYTPAANFSGTDTFEYKASDASTDSAPATVTITVTPVNDAPRATADTATVAEDGNVLIDVLANDDTGPGDTGQALALGTVGTAGAGAAVAGSGAEAGKVRYSPSANSNGTDTFTYQACDDGTSGSPAVADPLCATATVTVTVTAVNDAPVGGPDAYATPEDTALTVAAPGVLANDSDVDGDPRTAAMASSPAHGSATVFGDGSFSYSPVADYNGPDTFTYRVGDGTLQSDPVTVTIDVSPVADAPTAAGDRFAVVEDGVLSVAAPGVLAGDSDADGDALSAVLGTGPANGTLTLQPTGAFEYTPAANYQGTDTFTYRASDGTLSSAPATVTIDVGPVADPPVASPDFATVAEDQVLDVARPGVLANDSDADGDALTAALVTGPANGTLALAADGSWRYTPAPDFNGTDSFTYRAGDGTLTSDAVAVSISVTPVPDAPVATADSFETTEDEALRVLPAGGVLANDTDADGDALIAAIWVAPANGAVTLDGDGGFLYTPDADFAGTDTFTYKASDGSLLSDPTTVTITVAPAADRPVAVDDAYATAVDAVLEVAAPGVLANDRDLDGDALTAAVAAAPAHGVLTLRADGSFTFTPEAGFEGLDSFTYQASDATQASLPATVRLTIGDPNSAPTGTADAYATDEDAALAVDAASGVLANDSDADGDTLTVTVVDGPGQGSLTLAPTGAFSYTPAANYAGSDGFTYRINDGRVDSLPVAVTLTVRPVNDAPTAGDDLGATAEDTALTTPAPGLLANDADIDSGALTPVLVSAPGNGTLTLGDDGSYTYTPAPNFNGTDSFAYRVTDGSLQSAPATVTITVSPVNDAPVALADSATTPEDQALAVAAPGVLGNDTDVDSGALSAVLVSGPANGTLALAGDGSFTYTPAPNFNGTDTFTYRASDASTQSTPATATITVTRVNDLPVATADSFSVTEDTPLEVAAPGVLGNDADPDGDALTAVLADLPAHGTVDLQPGGGFRYVPAPDYHGPDGFTYRVDDGTARSAPVPVSLTVQAVADAPMAGDDTYRTDEDTALTVAAPGVLANDSDADGDGLALEQLTAPAHGTAALAPDGGFTYTPANGYSGTDSFTYRLAGEPAGAPATVTITVGPVVDPPVLADDEVELPEDGTAPVDVLANDRPGDPGQVLQLTSAAGASHGTATIEDARIVYRPQADWHGTDQVTYTACHRDGGPDGCATAVLNIVVTSVNDAPVSGPDAYETDEDSPLAAAAAGVLGNDTDADGDALSAAVVGAPAHGTLVLRTDGSVSYTPAANYNGPDAFTYRASDGTATGAVTTVTITVRPVNDAPVSAADSYATNEDTPLDVPAAGVLANDGDVDGPALSAVLVAGPGNGTVQLAPDGSFRYTPATNFHGTDTFTYRASDRTATTGATPVTITVGPVNDAPTAAGETYSTRQDAVLDAPAPGVLGNDADVDGPALSAILVAGTANGTVQLDPDGSFRYTPTRGWNGTDTFTYRATDGAATSAVTTVTVVVAAINGAPAAVDDSYTTVQRNGVVRQAPGVLANDRDPDGDALTAELVSGPAHGSVDLRPDGSFTYLPDPAFSGTDSFRYRVRDPKFSSEAVLSIVITPAPVPAAPPPEVSAGYWLTGGDGGVFSYGDAPFFGSTGDIKLNQPVVGIVATTSGNGYWLVASDGGLFAFGDAPFFGSTGSLKLNKPVVGMVPTPSGQGYWLVASDGGIFAFGDAPFFGSTGSMALNKPVVGMVANPSGTGYWMVASDGGIFAFGEAPFFGSTGDINLNRPIVAMVARPTGLGYWMVATDGGIFAFGDAAFRGSTGDRAISAPVISMAPTRSGEGYWLVGSDAAVYAFGDAGFYQGPSGEVTPIAGAVPNPSGTGLVLTDDRGAAFTFGQTEFTTDAPPLQLNSPIVGLALRP